jgi:hypothetical protein
VRRAVASARIASLPSRLNQRRARVMPVYSISRVFGPGTTIAQVADYLRTNARPRDDG